MDVVQKNLLTRFVIVTLFTTVIAGAWDTWWHVTVGRDTPFIPPHLLLYAAILVAIITSAYGWYRAREGLWRWLTIFIVIAPLTQPFDELWHRLFGIENLLSPLVIWSPPHVVLILSIMASLIVSLVLLRRDENPYAQRIFGGLTFAAILWLLLLLVDPLQPLGPWKVFGFWGAAASAGVFTLVLLVARRYLPGIGASMLTVAFSLLLVGMDFGHEENIARGVLITPHSHPPFWITIFAYLVPATIIDVMRQKLTWLRGAAVGLLYGGIFYGIAWNFIKQEFQYSVEEGVAAIVASLLGGAVAGILASTLQRKFFPK